MQYKHMEQCFLCKGQFQFGPGAYHGRWIREWKVSICDTCRRGNWDGIVPEVHPHLVDHLQAIAVDFNANENGWIDIPR